MQRPPQRVLFDGDCVAVGMKKFDRASRQDRSQCLQARSTRTSQSIYRRAPEFPRVGLTPRCGSHIT